MNEYENYELTPEEELRALNAAKFRYPYRGHDRPADFYFHALKKLEDCGLGEIRKLSEVGDDGEKHTVIYLLANAQGAYRRLRLESAERYINEAIF